MSHHPDPDQHDDLRQMFTAEFWDDRYAGADRVWSGRPNQRLVEQVADLTPGTAVDVGCGEGADVVWLARRGWTVTGVDVSGVALERAAVHAADEGVAVATQWARVDLLAGDPVPGPADLVTAAFVHTPPELLSEVYGRLASAVAVGGTLLVVAHHPDDVATGVRDARMGAHLISPEQVTAVLASGRHGDWTVEVAEAQPRTQVGPDQVAHAVTDTVVRARRRG